MPLVKLINLLFITFFNKLIISSNGIVDGAETKEYHCSSYYENIKENYQYNFLNFKNITLENTDIYGSITKIFDLEDLNLMLIFLNGDGIYILDKASNYTIKKKLKTLNFFRISEIIRLKNGWIASNAKNGYIDIWNPYEDFNLVVSFPADKLFITNIIELTDRNLLVTGSSDKMIKIWNITDNFSNIISFRSHNASITSLFAMSNGLVISGSEDNLIRIWNFTNIEKSIHSNSLEIDKIFVKGEEQEENFEDYLVTTLIGHREDINQAIQHSTLGIIISCSKDSTLKVWNPNNNFEEVYSTNFNFDKIDSLKELSNGLIAAMTIAGQMIIINPFDEFQFSTKLEGILSFTELFNGVFAVGINRNQMNFFMFVEKFFKYYSTKVEIPFFFNVADLKNGNLAMTTKNADEIFDVKILSPDLDFKQINSINVNQKIVKFILPLKNGNILISHIEGLIRWFDQNLPKNKNLIKEIDIDEKYSSLIELQNGNIAIGLNGLNIQIRDPNTEKFDIIFESNYYDRFPLQNLIEIDENTIIGNSERLKNIILWNWKKSQNTTFLKDGHDSPITNMVHVKFQNEIVSSSNDKIIIVWKYQKNNSSSLNGEIFDYNFKKLKVFEANRLNTTILSLLVLGEKYLITHFSDGEIKIFSILEEYIYQQSIILGIEADRIRRIFTFDNKFLISVLKDGVIQVYTNKLETKCLVKKVNLKTGFSVMFQIKNLKNLSLKSKNDPTSVLIQTKIPEFFISLQKNPNINNFLITRKDFLHTFNISASSTPISSYELIMYEKQFFVIIGCVDGSLKISEFLDINQIKEKYFLAKIHQMAINSIIALEKGEFLSCSDEGLITLWDLREPYKELNYMHNEKNANILKCLRSKHQKNIIFVITYSKLHLLKIENRQFNFIRSIYKEFIRNQIIDLTEDIYGNVTILTDRRLIIFNNNFDLINTLEKDVDQFTAIFTMKNFFFYDKNQYTVVGNCKGEIFVFKNIHENPIPIQLFKLNEGYPVVEIYESEMGRLIVRFSDRTIKVIRYRLFK